MQTITPENAILILNLALAAAIVVVAIRGSGVPGASSLLVMSALLAIWTGSYLIHGVYPYPLATSILTAVVIVSAMLVASSELAFCLSFTNRFEWKGLRTLGILAVMPLLTQVLFWYEPWRRLFFDELPTRVPYLGFGGPWSEVASIYLLFLSVTSVVLVLDVFIRTSRPLRLRSWALVAGSSIPVFTLLLRILGFDLAFPIEPALPAFTLCALGISYGVFSRGTLEAVPITRESAVDHMPDGWIILDLQNNIVDINPAAEIMLGLTRGKIYGQPISTALSDWPNLSKAFEGVQDLEMRRSIKSQDSWRYLSIRVSPLTNQRESLLGRLIVWSDVTKRRLAEDARQRARDEMFVLLNAISSAASHTIDLEDFLSETIYQIIYPFRSQVVAMFLQDERRKDHEEQRLFLASHLGLSEEAANSLAYLPVSSPLVDGVLQNRHPVLIDDVPNDPRAPAGLKALDLDCLLVSPLIASGGQEGKITGIICLARKEKLPFTPDEIARLSAISDQIATLIDSSRRRELAIALSERQRLLRDLHDSVSQKLYGLVTLTEAAQAALEAGSTVNPGQILARIGDNARQAVKEMRLFLYQIRPIDVEKDGIVSVLHHRLAAVEGRADIKARLLADEDIPLPRDKEVALYYIAEEGLNNVLRHAHAKSVLVTLKLAKRNVILEIRDDGVGFDPKKADIAGMGLRNMKERTMQIGGKLRIISRPGQGTRIVITVPKDQAVKRAARKRAT